MSQDMLIDKRSYLFALRIVKAYKYLTKQQNEYVLSKQMLRSGTAIGVALTLSARHQ